MADHQGSIVALTNGSGVATYVNTYDEYGIPSLGNFGRFQYTGQVWIPEANVYHYKARAYSPVLGRFLQTDPSGYDDGMNMYAYVGDDPVNRADPTGTMGGDCCTIFGLGSNFFFGANENGPAVDNNTRRRSRIDVDAIRRQFYQDYIQDFWGRFPPLENALDEALAYPGAGTATAAVGGIRAAAGTPAGKKLLLPAFRALKDHALRHSGLTANAYLRQAAAHLGSGSKFNFYHDGKFKNAFITRTGGDTFMFTSASPTGRTIYTHMEVNSQYLRNIGITLPKGF